VSVIGGLRHRGGDCKDNVTGAKGGILSGMTGTQGKITCL
jgi:hypothetical protein